MTLPTKPQPTRLAIATLIAFIPITISADDPVVEPGGYQAGLTILMKPPPGIRVFGPGLPTPAPGGKFVARLNNQPSIKTQTK